MNPSTNLRSNRIIGIDPGSQTTGIGIIEDRGDHYLCLHAEALRLDRGRKHAKASRAKKGSTTKSWTVDQRTLSTLPGRLHLLHERLKRLVDEFHPDAMSIEALFHGRNVQSALTLGHARGIALLVAAQYNLQLAEYAPREVKKGLTGSGAASKEQVRQMVRLLLHGETSSALDATDALALALYHGHLQPLRSAGHRRRGSEGELR